MSGHKAAAAAVPNIHTTTVTNHDVKARNFVDVNGNKVTKRKLNVLSLQLLPMRQILLLGCEDGMLRACV